MSICCTVVNSIVLWICLRIRDGIILSISMFTDMQDKSYEDRLQCLGLWTLEERRNRQDLIEVFKMLKGFSSVSLHELFYDG